MSLSFLIATIFLALACTNKTCAKEALIDSLELVANAEGKCFRRIHAGFSVFALFGAAGNCVP